MYGVCRMARVPHHMERNEDRPVTLVELKRIFRENEMFSGYGPSSETQGQIAEARASLNGQKKMATKKSIVG